MSKKVAISLMTIFALSTAVFAQDTNTTETSTQATENSIAVTNSHANGFYVGLGYGMSGFNDGDFGKEFDNFKVASDNYTDSGFKLYGGYKFNKIIGVEAIYTSYGTMNFKYTEGGTGTATEIKPNSLNVAANLGYDFLDNQLRPYALVGLGYINYNQTGAQNLYTTDGAFAGVFGIGLEYSPTLFQGVGFRLAYDNTFSSVTMSYPNKDDESYAQSLGMLSLNVQYRF